MDSKEHRLIGTQLGTCILEKPIGAGGMGMIFLARQTRPTREVAVKVLSPRVELSQEQHAEFLARFRREADVIAQLDHIHILPIHEYGEQDGLAYLVMPYLKGGSLRDLLKRRGMLSLKESLSYIEQTASALQYAHEHKIVHRDIKPGNMLFHADGRLLLADFGIARILRDPNEPADVTLTGSGHFLGSVEYMAPEMIQERPVDGRADIYELGIVLFQMLTGRVPFQGESTFTIATKHVLEPPPYLSQLVPALPPALDDVVRKAIAKKPEDRYSSAREFAQALREVVAQPVTSHWSTVPDIAATHVIQAPAQAQTPAPVLEVETRSTFSSSFAGPTQLSATADSLPPIATSSPLHTSNSNSNWSHSDQRGEQVYTPTTPRELPARQQQPPPPYTGVTPDSASTHFVPATPEHFGQRNMGMRLLSIALLLCLVAGLAVAGFLYGPQLLNNILPHPSAPVGQASSTPTPTPTPTPNSTPTPTVEEQVKSVIINFYQAINNKDYQTAYQHWGNDYHSKNPFAQFRDGFSKTQSDAITISSLALQNDGTYKVNVTLKAQETANGGSETHTFQGYYIVGQEDNTWKMLTANFQEVTNT